MAGVGNRAGVWGYGPAMADEQVRAGLSVAVPDYGETPFVTPPSLDQACVALCTTAALHLPDDEPYGRNDTRFRLLPGDRRDLVLGHTSQNFDRIGATIDLNVVYPTERLDELAGQGVIGSVSPVHATFVGNQTDETLETVLLDSGPAAAQALLDAGVDVVVLTPV
jgi:D-proline reductase (dithiol) PrdB